MTEDRNLKPRWAAARRKMKLSFTSTRCVTEGTGCCLAVQEGGDAPLATTGTRIRLRQRMAKGSCGVKFHYAGCAPWKEELFPFLGVRLVQTICHRCIPVSAASEWGCSLSLGVVSRRTACKSAPPPPAASIGLGGEQSIWNHEASSVIPVHEQFFFCSQQEIWADTAQP